MAEEGRKPIPAGERARETLAESLKKMFVARILSGA